MFDVKRVDHEQLAHIQKELVLNLYRAETMKAPDSGALRRMKKKAQASKVSPMTTDNMTAESMSSQFLSAMALVDLSFRKECSLAILSVVLAPQLASFPYQIRARGKATDMAQFQAFCWPLISPQASCCLMPQLQSQANVH